ncbi:MAG: lipid II flippase MurJ [Candidatus Adlerbacteria bacterium]|nr:lipid II flippase MurJ [Candidatus Adlerbacteria bacterium]
MVRSFFLAVMGLEVRGMHQAAYVLASFALASQLLALLRDRLLASSFGASETLDLYYAAFRLPDLLFVGVASLLSIYALLPILSKLEAEAPGLIISFLRKLLFLFFVGMGGVSLVAFFFVPEIVRFIAPGLANNEALIMLTRILLLQPILLGASNLLANLTQLKHRFVLYSISPLLYNLGIIGGIIFLYPTMGLAGLAWGVVFGAALHVLVQVPFFTLERESGELSWQKTATYAREVLMLSVPRTLALAAGQVSLLVAVALASLLPEGSIAIFTFAWNLQAVPLTIIGVSYSVAAFPTLARFFAGNNREEFVRHVESALKHIIFWSLPAIFLIIVLRAHIVRVILGAGVFDWIATRLTAAALALFVIALLAQSISLLIARAYYAAGNTRKPLMLAALEVTLSVGAMVVLLALFSSSQFFKLFVESLLRVDDVPGTAVLCLALALSIGALARAGLGLWWLIKDFKLLFTGVGRLAFQGFAAAVIGGAAAYATLQLFEPVVNLKTVIGVAAQGTAAGLVGLVAVGVTLFFLKNKELAEIASIFRRHLTRGEAVAVEPSDVA